MYPSYSIAIRTLGTAGDKFIRELNSIANQTIKPDKVIIYIADGYNRPTYTIGIEEYIEVTKGMVAQRTLDYDEINSEFILMLDDDMELQFNSVELLLNAAMENNADCITADVYHNHKMPIQNKIYNIITNLIIPFNSNNWSRKILSNGSIAYNNNPIDNKFYLAQSGEGGAILCKKKIIKQLCLNAECWLDKLEFAYADDQLITHKIYANGYKLGTLYNSGIQHLDNRSARVTYQNSSSKFITRSQAMFIIWYRSLFNVNNISTAKKIYRLISFVFKQIWIFPILIIASIRFKNWKIPIYHYIGIYKGIKFIKTLEFKNLPNYIINV